MDTEEFRKRGKEMVDFIANYMTNIGSLRVIPDTEPGFIRPLLPNQAPQESEPWEDIMKDVVRVVMPGLCHWQHPDFHAYFPAGNSYPSILGGMLSDAFGCVGFSWAASPACTELETLVLDWIGKMIHLPREFLNEPGDGGGVIQGSASEGVLVALLSARHRLFKRIRATQALVEEADLLPRLVGYCSQLAHSCVEKAGMIAFVKIRHLKVDDNHSLRGPVLKKAIEEDRAQGLLPFYVCATLGTTSCCSFDNVVELGQVTSAHGLYLHVDAAYAGNALICPEFQYLNKGFEHVDSFGFNTNKWLQVNFDCSLLWVRQAEELTTALNVNPVYLQHKHGSKTLDLRHWGIPLSRRFRALKLWFVLRTYGVRGLQNIIRQHVNLAKLFEKKVMTDDRFEIVAKVTMGLVCFRLKGCNSKTVQLLDTINEEGRLHMVPTRLDDDNVYAIRFALCTEHACEADVNFAWEVILSTTEALSLKNEREHIDGTLLFNGDGKGAQYLT